MYEFDLIIGAENSYDTFIEAWDIWKHAILEYSRASVSKPKMLKHALRDADASDLGNVENLFFFCILA